MENKIVRQIEVKAPISRVWKAITDHKEFGIWFRAKVEEPFRVGEMSSCRMDMPGLEHLRWQLKTLVMEVEKLFVFEWPPYVPDKQLEGEPWQRVEFHLQETHGGTLVTLTESGFELLSEQYREDARRGNEEGWDIQTENLRAYLA